MIYVTGDTHGLHDFEKLRIFSKAHPELTARDYVIIAGDFGGIWDEQSEIELAIYAALPFTVLFVDGNHENFDMLDSFPVEMWKGGKVHKIKPNIIHLMRGQVFEIDGNTIFTFGGATSVDKYRRVEGRSWWKQENPTLEELDEGIANLKRYNNKVDYIITHSCSKRALMYPALRFAAAEKFNCPENGLLSNFDDTVEYKHWYFGHFHVDERLGDRYTALMNDVVVLGE